MSRFTYSSIIGNILIISDECGICEIILTDNSYPLYNENDKYIESAVRWFDLYFGGTEPDFVPELSLNVSKFRKKAYDILLSIPYGTTITYKEAALKISDRMSAQAIGQACKHNPIPFIIPCHRIVAANGPGGYAYGDDIKLKLLMHENIDISRWVK